MGSHCRSTRRAIGLKGGESTDPALEAYLRGAWDNDGFTGEQMQQMLGYSMRTDVYYLLDLFGISRRRGGRERANRQIGDYRRPIKTGRRSFA